MKRTVEGQVTVFISLIMMCTFALFGMLLESARTAGARWYLQTAAFSAMDSVFSQYHRELWDSYRLLFAEYENGEELAADFSGFIAPYLETENWYPIKEKQISVEKICRATDAGGMYFEKEILDYMKYGVWTLDFGEDEAMELWNTAKEASAVTQTARRYRGHGKEALKLEKDLERISRCLEKQREHRKEGIRCLNQYNGSGFRREAKKLVGKLEEMPGLIEAYQNQADHLARSLDESRKAYDNGEKGECRESVQKLLEQEIREYESYVAADGERRKEIVALSRKSEEQRLFVQRCIQEAEEIEEQIEAWESEDEDEDGPDLNAMWSPLRHRFEGLSISELSFAHGVKDKEKESLLNQVGTMYQSGLLKWTIPEGTVVSPRTVGAENLVSGMESADGVLGLDRRLFDHMLVNEYCGKFFQNFCESEFLKKEPQNQESEIKESSGPAERALAYEVEYLLGGMLSDRDNLTQTVQQLLAVREGINLLHILSDPSKRADARNLAMVITGAAAITPLLLVTSFFIMSVWALGESLMDVRGLLAGRKVPLLKTEESWTLSLKQLLDMGQEQRVDDGGGESGLSYLSWLKILLFMKDKRQQEYRMMDLIQLNLMLVQENFRMRNGVYQAGITGTFSGKHVFFSLGFVEAFLGQTDHTYPMMVQAERRY